MEGFTFLLPLHHLAFLLHSTTHFQHWCVFIQNSLSALARTYYNTMHAASLMLLPALMLLSPVNGGRPYYPLPTPEGALVHPMVKRQEAGTEHSLNRKEFMGRMFPAVSSSSTKSESGDFTASVPIS
ncbi:hypothetical protein DL89DRAFT_254894 [Linderina pennispora]|uniref:Uncharacterized protein n=1 Tax=Linderina pennispora TaxID=61395 RepID=A0A1Y1WH95_9FUNG|nr:uncharacterized protein DL89DRAFT_254894 [Linderina pennispora]ORX72708.1 hypothetical protein DL89DRAFT_254894 [Linderina pennispora]